MGTAFLRCRKTILRSLARARYLFRTSPTLMLTWLVDFVSF